MHGEEEGEICGFCSEEAWDSDQGELVVIEWHEKLLIGILIERLKRLCEVDDDEVLELEVGMDRGSSNHLGWWHD